MKLPRATLLGTILGEVASVLRRHRGRAAVLEGTTQIRAGAVRPHVFLPHEV